MNIDTLNVLFDEAVETTSPQFRDADAGERSGRPSFAPDPLSLIVALAAELEASEARARRVEDQLAAHDRHCICRASAIAAEEAMELADCSAGHKVAATVNAEPAYLDGFRLAA